MAKRLCVSILGVVLLLPLAACAHTRNTEAVDVCVISDHGREYATYKVHPRPFAEGRNFYLEAVKGERYSLRVTNRSGRRVGVVVAVDGRNIVSGRKSNLGPDERMYILGAHETYTLDGWRSGVDRTNRFYFTDQADSYAEKAFADGSAMGTIAVAVYREKIPPVPALLEQEVGSKDSARGAAPSPSLEAGKGDRNERMKSHQAGTGFGETTYSPVRVVRFEPEGKYADRIVFKYEWRAELVKRGVIRPNRENRFWPYDGDFAPPPPDFRG
jgi:hypothetical protein